MSARKFGFGLISLAAVALTYAAHPIGAGEVALQDGTVLSGGYPIFLSTVGPRAPRPDPEKSPNLAIITIDEAGAVRFYVPRLQATKVERDSAARKPELFKLHEEKRPKPKRIEQVAGQLDATPWDKFGHRRVGFRSGDKRVDLMQEIVELTPKYAKVTAMDFLWEFAIPTQSIPDAMLDEILHAATKPDNPDDRLAIARFYLDGEFYRLAQKELDSISQDFPAQARQVEQLTIQLKQYLADEALGILEERREAGQHEFAYQTAKRFLDLKVQGVSVSTLQKLRQGVAQYEQQRSQTEDVRQLLGQLQAKLPAELAAEVAPIRTAIAEDLHPATMDRLAPFLNLIDAENRQADEKLALALSGWVVGPDQAITDLKNALRLWEARALVQEYLRAENPAEHAAIIEKLQAVEGIGPQQVLRLLPLLPPRLDTPHGESGSPISIETSPVLSSETPVQYDVLLPLEYHPARSYPAVVVLHAEGQEPAAELRWWARQAQRFGYLLIAPRYMGAKQRSYDYSAESHRIVLESITDARRRFNINSDRIFLGGHGVGGDATFDIGYSHPHLFAGIMPVTAICEKFSQIYWENAKRLPQFIIAGELDRTATEDNTKVIDHLMVGRCPVIYAVFTGRGHEDFQSEDIRLFDWMSRQKRQQPPTEIDIRTARTSDNSFWWWKFANFPPKFGATGWPTAERGQPKPMLLSASARRSKGGNVINLTCGARWHALWLYPQVVSFEERLIVRHNGTQLYNEIPEPDIAAMLEDFRLRADRQQIAWAYLELGTLASRNTARNPRALPQR